ncbi:MAG: head GIN domain-containing protein [Betaproteobacteria bacterium]
MRRLNAPAATHLLTALAVTAAAVLTAFAMPLPASAVTITINGDAKDFTNGSGKEANVARKVGAFSVLRLDSSVDVVAHQGPAPAVTVHADDNIEPMIETVVEGDTLVVRMRKNVSFRTNHKVLVDVVFTSLTASQQRGSGDLHIDTVTGPRFESSISGSGDLRIDNAKVGNFALSIAGSGDVQIAGSADDARFAVAGSGDISAGQFAVKHVIASISGSGDAHLNALESIDARVAGSGDISYSGHPKDVTRRVSGSGSIEASN